MGRVIKDLMTGSVLVIGGIIAAFVLLIVMSVIGFFMHILAMLASALFFVALVLFLVWMAGYFYRKAREKRLR